jgi:4-hydroxybenzoate polyprenyltransferase
VEVFFSVLYNDFNGDANPLIRNVLNAIGIGCFYAGPVQIAHGNISLLSTPKALCWIILLGLSISLTVHTQDFRDVKGDKKRSRRTIPLVFSDLPARYSVVAGSLVCSCVTSLFWGVGIMGFLLPGIIGPVMAVNWLGNQTLDGDKLSWKIWAYWMLSLFVLPFFSVL